jgi:YD repeat-containing protein
MSRKRFILLLGSACLLFSQSQGQTPALLQSGSVDSKLLPSGSSGTNVSSPNLFNGTSNVAIPIYKDISLSYNTAGVKVDEPSGIVGLHWSLNGVPSITRVLKDVPDEINVSFPNPPQPQGSNSPIDAVTAGMEGKFSVYNLGNNTPFDPYSAFVDDESDDFIFSAGGLSFTFNIGNNGFIFTNPHKNIKIDLLLNGSPVTTTTNKIPTSPSFATMNEISFRVRDAQGNWYYFQKGDVTHKVYGDVTNPDLSFDYISRWVVTKIVQADGSETDYQYNVVNATGNIAYMAYSGYEQNVTQITYEANAGVPFNRDLAYSSNISNISYPNGTSASFIYSNPASGRCDDPGNTTLSEIQIISLNAGIRYVFDQDWAISKKTSNGATGEVAFGSSCQTIDATPGQNYRYLRLLLKGIHKASLDGAKTEPYYTFNYKTGIGLPPKLSGAQDYFGYFNGRVLYNDAYDGTFNIQSHTAKYPPGSTTTYGVDKTEDWNYAIGDILDTVKNAYGGKTAFVYEPHVLSNVLSDAGITIPTDNYFFGANANDGVRVKCTYSMDDRYPGKYKKEAYTYSGGQRFLPGGRFDYPVYTINPNDPYAIYSTANVSFNGNFVSPHQLINGSNHGYSGVTITESNDQGQQFSQRVITFQNVSMGAGNTSYYRIGSDNYFELPYTDKQYIKDWEIGLPLTTTDYDQNGLIISQTTNTYKSLIDNTSSNPNVQNIHRLSTVENGILTPNQTDAYMPYTGVSLLMQSLTKKYVSNASFSSNTIKYHYDGNNNEDADTTQNSLGEIIVHKNIYNYSVNGPNVINGNPPGTLYNMSNDGLEIQVGTETWKMVSAFNDLLLGANIVKYQYSGGILLPQKNYALQSLAPIVYSTYTGINSSPTTINPYANIVNVYSANQLPANFQVGSEVLSYDTKGNPTEIQFNGQNSYVASIYDPIPGQKLAEVQNANYADIASTSFEPLVGNNYTGTGPTVNGKFTFDQYGIAGNAGSVSGLFCFKLVPSPTANTYINSPVLNPGKSYVITFWVKELNTAGYLPKLADPNGQSIPYNQVYETGNFGWWFCEARYTPTISGSLTFSTIFPASYVDEIRLFPTGAMMKNWTYDSFLGTTSSTDPTGRITYYVYDALGHLVATKDQEGNILSKTETHNGI